MLELEEQSYIATKSHREPPVFARKGQNGVAQAQAQGVEAIISPIGPASVVRRCPTKNGMALAANQHEVRGSSAKWVGVAVDYSVFIPVCLPWGPSPGGSEAPKKKEGAERYLDMLWRDAKRCESYAEPEAGKLSLIHI